MESAEKPRHPGTAGTLRKFLPWSEIRILLLFLAIAVLWILFFDMVLPDWMEGPRIRLRLRMHFFTALNFVATMAVLLLVALRRSFEHSRRVEQQLRQIKERFEFAGRAGTDAIWDWDLVTNAVWHSEGFYTVFGYAEQDVELTTESWRERIHPGEKDRVLADIQRAIGGDDQVWSGEYRYRRKDGSYAWVQDRAFIIREAGGKAVRLIGGLSDVTARKQAEEKLDQSRQQLRALSAHLESLREEERTQIAREIHDELGQTLTGLKMDLRWVEKHLSQGSEPARVPILDKIVEAGELADATLASVQRISAELRPSVLEDLGLPAALKHEAQRFQDRTGIVCQLHAADFQAGFPLPVATAVFRIFQETLTNVARHAEARAVQVELREEDGQWVLLVADNGKGIRPSDLTDAKSLGLLGMEERATLLGGEVTFQSGAQGGTVVTLRLPQAGAIAQPPDSP
jgi:two-component system sensor histidine kinase UhpB